MEDRRIRLVMELRRAGIEDTGVLSAIERLPREAFVDAADAARVWDDVSLGGLARPLHAAIYLQALGLGGRERVLVLPAGSGYLAALLGPQCRWVYAVEADRSLRKAADERLKALRITNVVSRVGDPLQGWPEQAPFDRILVDQVVPAIPTALLAQLRDGSNMIVPIGEQKFATITRVVRDGAAHTAESILRTSFALYAGRD